MNNWHLDKLSLMIGALAGYLGMGLAWWYSNRSEGG
jgi:hypothetical protein